MEAVVLGMVALLEQINMAHGMCYVTINMENVL